MAPKTVKTDMPFTVFSREADNDYLLARMTSFFGGGFRGRAGYFGQQSCEKYLKALSVQYDGTYLETHKLIELASACAHHYEFLKNELVTKVLEKFDVFEQVGRYGAAANFDPLSKGKAIDGTQFYPTADVQIAGAWIWTEDHLRSLDRFVFNARGRLDFKKVNFDDGLVSILTDNKASMMLDCWTGPTPLKDVLTRGNEYFTPECLKPTLPGKS